MFCFSIQETACLLKKATMSPKCEDSVVVANVCLLRGGEPAARGGNEAHVYS